MLIESFRVQNFKSLADVQLLDLSAINVFHGLNDVGKSNLLQAMDLFFQLFPLAMELETEWEGFTGFDLQPYSQNDIFRRQTDSQRIEWEVCLRLPNQATSQVRLRLERKEQKRQEDEYKWDLALTWPNGRPDDKIQHDLCTPRAGFNLLTARRRFQAEYLEQEPKKVERRTRRPQVTARNLKRTLFDAYASLDLDERARFKELEQLLERHFRVGRLDVGLDRSSGKSQLAKREVIARFLRPATGAVTIENVGSGARQALLTLGQLLFNPARIAGIEEPEMNLNPDWQTRLLALLRDLIGPEAGQFDQFFISSHSPQFEAAEHFYDVTYADGQTRVQKLPLPQRNRYFARLAQGEQMGPYLNSLNQVTLPQQVIDDLGLRRREPVFFYKAPDGHWRLRTKAEVLALMEDGEEYDVEPDADDGDSAG